MAKVTLPEARPPTKAGRDDAGSPALRPASAIKFGRAVPSLLVQTAVATSE